jgi:transposase
MARPLLSDHLWESIRFLFPPHPVHSKGGRPFLDDRKVLTGILFVLKTGIPWEDLPQEMGCGCGMTSWRRLRAWQKAGVWQEILGFLLEVLRFLKRLDFSRFLIDSSHVRAVGAGPQTGPSPVDRRKAGSKIHLLTDAQGTPVTARLTAGNRNDTEQTIPLIDQVPPIAGGVGRPRRRPDRLQGDRGYDDEHDRQELRRRHIEPILPKRRSPHGSGLGRFRWFIERTISWLKQFRRLRIRYDRDPANYVGFLFLAMSLICYRVAFPGLC